MSGRQELVNVLFKLITIFFSAFPHSRCESRFHQCNIMGVKFFSLLGLVAMAMILPTAQARIVIGSLRSLWIPRSSF